MTTFRFILTSISRKGDSRVTLKCLLMNYPIKKRFILLTVTGTTAAIAVGLLFVAKPATSQPAPSPPPSAQPPPSAAPKSASTPSKGIVKTCAGLEIRSIDLSYDQSLSANDAAHGAVDIEAVPTQGSTTTSDSRVLTVSVLGPVLGSMDSPNVKTNLTCAAKGLLLTATLTRSADYRGAVLADVNWRPRIEIVVVLHRPKILLQTAWRMRLTTGAELNHAQTSPYAEQRYPITASKTIP